MKTPATVVEALSLGPYVLIDTEKMHLFATTLEEIDPFIADKPEVITPLHDKHDYQRLRQHTLSAALRTF
jgi:hypothetical protein